MQNLAKEIVELVGFGGLLAFGVLGREPVYEDYRQTYQGYTNFPGEGTPSYIFDSIPIERRETRPQFVLAGEDTLENYLKIGKEYDFTIEIKPLRTPKIVSIKPTESNSTILKKEIAGK